MLLIVSLLGALLSSAPFSTKTAHVSGCRVVDGDTLRCGSERIRLLGIDAPELGRCNPPGRRCAPGDGKASTNNLRLAMSGKITINRVSKDRYGRTIALVTGVKGDLSCWQLRHRQAIYRADWDNGRLLAKSCRATL